MKIGIISEPLTKHLTGVGKYTYNLILELTNMLETRDIQLITSRRINDFATILQRIIDNPFEKISKIYLWYLYVSLVLSKESTNLDVIHNLYQASTFFTLKKRKYKYIITVHDITQLLFPNYIKRSVYLIQKNLLPKHLKVADMIITDSYNTKKDIINYLKIPEEKIRVVPLGINDKYKPLSSEELDIFRQKYNLKYPFVLYVGSVIKHKNVPTLIKAFYKIKKQDVPHKLVIAGKKGWGHSDINRTIKKLNLQKDVIFIGYVPERYLPALYNTADLFVYPSLYEGFGLPPLEAMACGTPVITSNTSSLPEVVGNAGIMVDPYDVDGLAKAMYEVLTNEGLREELRKKGLERARLFSWRKTAKETLKVYEEVYHMR